MITASPVPEGVGWSPAVHSTSRDVRISRRALGALVELLSYPPGWDMNADKLAKLGREGREATRKAMRELEDAGYVIHLVYRGSGGRMLTASFAGNLPEVARALADAWLEENAHLNAKQKPSSHRGTADRASVNQASVNRASADRTSVDWASSIRQTEETDRKTDPKTDENTVGAAAPPRPIDFGSTAIDNGAEATGRTINGRATADAAANTKPIMSESDPVEVNQRYVPMDRRAECNRYIELTWRLDEDAVIEVVETLYDIYPRMWRWAHNAMCEHYGLPRLLSEYCEYEEPPTPAHARLVYEKALRLSSKNADWEDILIDPLDVLNRSDRPSSWATPKPGEAA